MDASKIEIQNITISSFDGNSFDISDLVVELNIFEDLFSNTLSASIIMTDSSGVLSNLPVIGQEMIQLVFKTPFTNLKLVKFLVYKVEDVILVNQHTSSYILHCISSEAVQNSLTSVSKYYQGTASQIVQNCFADFIKTEKKLNVEGSKITTEVIVPYWSPFYFFNWIAARTVPRQGTQPSYVFYETMKDGFNFKSIESMLSKKSVTKWIRRNTSIDINDQFRIDKERASIIDFKIVEAYNMIDHCIDGLVGTKVFVKDLLSKSMETLKYNYLDDFDKTKHASKHPMIPSKNAFGMKYSGKYTEPKIVFGHQQLFGGNDPDNYIVWVNRRKSFIEQISAQILQLTMNGDTEITIGDMVDIEIPDNLPVGAKSINNSLLSGKYLISSIRHIIKGNNHIMSVEAIKESHDFLLGTRNPIIMGT